MSLKGFGSLIFLLLVSGGLILVGLYFYVTYVRQPEVHGNLKESIPNGGISQPSYRVEFQYSIKSVDKDGIVLLGRDGELSLSRDFISLIYKGPDSSFPLMSFDNLEMGDSVNLEVQTGKSATLFVMPLI